MYYDYLGREIEDLEMDNIHAIDEQASNADRSYDEIVAEQSPAQEAYDNWVDELQQGYSADHAGLR